MNADFVSREVPIHAHAGTGTPANRTLRLAVAGALLVATAHFGIMREHPEVDAAPDAIALVAFSQALGERMAAEPALSAALRPPLALPGSRRAED